MKRKYLRSCIALLLVFTVLCCGAVSASAYEPIVTIKSAEWEPLAETLTAYDYPNGIMIGDDEQEFKKFKDLYGDTCYFSSDDSLLGIESVDITINPKDFKYDGFYIFEYRNTIYLYNFNPVDFTFCFTSAGQLKIYPWCDEWNAFTDWYDLYLDSYYCVYPYDSFEKGATYVFSDYLDSGELPEGSYPLGEYMSFNSLLNLWPNYCTEDVYGMQDDIDHNIFDVMHEANLDVSDTVDLNLELTTPLKVYAGHARFELSAAQIQQFKCGRYAFLIDNIGFINGYDCRYAFSMYQLQVFNKDLELLDNVTLFKQDYYDAIGFNADYDEPLPAYQGVIDDYVVYWDNDYVDLSDDTYYCFVAFVFACDTFSAFFPGDIEIVEFESYEDDMEHSEVLGAVNEATDLINGQISSSSSALSQEIADAASDMKDSINNSAADIVSSVDSAASDISDKLDGVSDSIDNASDKLSDKLSDVKDGITNKLTEVKDNLLDGIKSFFIPSDDVMEEIDDKWDELLKTRFGALYEVSGIITDFANEMSWDYVKSAGTKDTITMPAVTVKLVDTDFTFGGYEVKVVPDGFDVLTTALKGITSIVCTLLFVNALRRKYDKLVGGGSS